MMNIFRLEQGIQSHMMKHHVPGTALALVKDDEVIYARGYGVTSVDSGAYVSSQTLFRIGSITKPLVGTAVMRLVEQGKLDLDRPVGKYVEWLRFSEKNAEKYITLRMLMSHTAGLPGDSRTYCGSLEKYIREQMPRYLFVASPGKVFSYSNISLNLVGYIAQVVSGKSFQQLIQELVFDPLDMQRTTFDPLVAMTYPLALPHVVHEDEKPVVLHRISDSIAYAPAGGAYSTVLDLANFAILHLQQGRFQRKQILSTQSIMQMHTLHANKYTVDHAGYGLTFEMVQRHSVSCIEHGGSMSTYGAQLIIFPEKKLAFALTVNRINYMKHLVDFVIDELPGVSATSVHSISSDVGDTHNTGNWSNYVGTYLNVRSGLATISIQDNQLLLTRNQQSPISLQRQEEIYAGYQADSDKGISVGFVSEKIGLTQYVMVDGLAYKRIELKSSFVPAPSSWTRYVGIYKDRENSNGETITVHVQGNILKLSLLDADTYVTEWLCQPIDEMRFVGEHGLIEFLITENGEVLALRAMTCYTFTRITT